MAASRGYLRLTTLAIASLVAGTASAAPPRQIVLFIADDQSPDTVSAYGPSTYSTAMPTPNIDQLASNGVKFSNSFVVQSTCTPGRGGILTGLYWTGHGIKETGETMEESVVTIADRLRTAGYRTAFFGKFNLIAPADADLTPVAYGFDAYDVFPPGASQGRYERASFVTNYEHPGEIDAGTGWCPGTGLPPSNTDPCERIVTGYSTKLITDYALAWMTAHAGEKVFVVIAVKGPHDPMVYEDCTLFGYETCNQAILPGGATPTDFAHPSTWDDVKPRRGRTGTGKTIGAHLLAEFNSWELSLFILPRPTGFGKTAYTGPPTDAAKTEHQFQRHIKDYLRTLKSVDTAVGSVQSYLTSHQLTASTLFAYIADNGFLNGEHGGLYNKQNMYEESIRVPLLIQYPCGANCGVAPAIAAGQTRPEIVINLDLAVTLLDYAEVGAPAWLHGRSLEDLLDGSPATDWRTSFYYHDLSDPAAANDVLGVRSDRYKLLYYPSAAVPNWELIDLQLDPGERTDVYTDPSYASVVAQLKAELNQHRLLIGELQQVPALAPGATALLLAALALSACVALGRRARSA